MLHHLYQCLKKEECEESFKKNVSHQVNSSDSLSTDKGFETTAQFVLCTTLDAIKNRSLKPSVI